MNGALFLFLLGPFYIWVDAIDVGKEALGVILVDRNEGVIRLTQPNKSSKDCTWSAVPDALLGVIS